MTGLRNIFAWGELGIIPNLEVPESNLDELTSLVLCNWTLLVAAYSGTRTKPVQHEHEMITLWSHVCS